jgi:O-antigen ligase
MRRVALIFVVLYAFAVPWEYSLDMGPPFGNIARMLGLSLLVVSCLAVARSGFARSPGPLQWTVVVLFLWLSCTFLWSIDPNETLTRLRGYLQEMVTVWIVWEFVDSRADLRWLIRALVAGSWVLAFLTLLTLANRTAGTADVVRFVAEGQDPNDVAHILDLALPLAALLACQEETWRARLLGLSYLPVGFFAVLLTGSRGGFLAELIALAGSGFLLFRRVPGKVHPKWLVLPALLAVLTLLLPGLTSQRLATIPEQLLRGDLNQRLNIWDVGWRAFARAPFFGSGAGTFVSAAGTASADTAHNTALSIGVEGGVCAVILASAVIAGSALAVARLRGVTRVAFATVLLVWMVTSLVATLEQTRTTWLLFAMIAAAGRLTSSFRPSTVDPGPRTVRARCTV